MAADKELQGLGKNSSFCNTTIIERIYLRIMQIIHAHRRTPAFVFAVATLGATLLVAGCSDDTADTSATTAEPTTTVAGSPASDDTSTTGAGTAATVNANEATVEELTAAFDSAGVPNAERWAREVEEYRPYTDDGWAHLRQELSKYNIDQATFDKIVGTLEL